MVRRALFFALRAGGFQPRTFASGSDFLEEADSLEPGCVLLDLRMPGLDGFEVLRALRTGGSSLPVVILTARDGVRDTVAGLEGGADDYIAKPFRFEELLARVRLRLRGERAPEETVLTVGDLSLDLRTRRAVVRGATVDLTAREFALAEVFFRHPGQVLSREQLLSHVWGYDHDPGSNVVDVYVGYLRRKLGKERFTSVRGMGYRLEPDVARSPAGRILVVEDEARIAEFVERGLREDGHEVLVAQDGEVGVFLALTEDLLDLVVLDIGLPGASGHDVLAEVKAGRPELPVVVLTGHDEPAVRERCLAAGAAGFLAKPLVVDELREVVGRTLAG